MYQFIFFDEVSQFSYWMMFDCRKWNRRLIHHLGLFRHFKMHHFTKRKFTCMELDDVYLPEKGQLIAKSLESRGNRLFKIIDQLGEEYLVSLPLRFSHVGYLKSGNYLIVEPIKEGKKVRGEVARILYEKQVQYIVENGQWPKCFDIPFNVKRKLEKANRTTQIEPSLLPPSSSSDSDLPEDDE